MLETIPRLDAIPQPSLFTKEYRTLTQIKGPLIFFKRVGEVAYNEVVEIIDPQGQVRLGQVLEVDRRHCMVRVFVGTSGLDLARTRARFSGDVARLGVSLSLLGRVLDGSGQPIDGADVLAVHASPKPPPERVTLSASRLSRTRQALFLVTGKNKRAALTAWRQGRDIPARYITPPGGVDLWLDANAA